LIVTAVYHTCTDSANNISKKRGNTNTLTFSDNNFELHRKNKGGTVMLDFIRKMTLTGAGLAIMTTEKIQEGKK